MNYAVAAIRFLLLATALSVGGCAGENTADEPSDELLVFAAASTTDAVEELCQGFQQEHDLRARPSFAATSMLARQIVNGAEAHVLISANESWADYLERQGMVAKRQDLLQNRLVVIVPADSQLEVGKLEDLLTPQIEHLAIADPDAAPAGIYARKALGELKLYEQLKGRIVAAPDVRRALVHVEDATVEAGIVYATDAAASGRVRVVLEIAPELTGPIRYPIVLLAHGSLFAHGSGDRSAERFYDYLRSPPAAEIFRRHGFLVPKRPDHPAP